MYQGKLTPAGKVGDYQDRWHIDPKEGGPRKGTEYRAALRNNARLAHRLAKKTIKDIEKAENV
jgi:hypothetical protein